MKASYLLFFLISVNFLFGQEDTLIVSDQKLFTEEIRNDFARSISKARLKIHIETLAADSMQGREAGTKGEQMALDYIKDVYENNTGLKLENNLQKFYLDRKDCYNFYYVIPGSEKPDEFIALSAHYDHIGKASKKTIYNGADDNASGTAALMEMLRMFQKAYLKGYRPKRSIVFLHFTAEELGLWGSKAFIENNNIPFNNFVANVNLDMVGRVDKKHKKNSKYIYSVGSDYFGDNFKSIINDINKSLDNLEISFRYNPRNHPEYFYKRTDSYPFSVKGIPFVFFTSGQHPDYHTPTDTAEKIDYNALTYRTRLFFALIWELANRKERIKVDDKKVEEYKANHDLNRTYFNLKDYIKNY